MATDPYLNMKFGYVGWVSRWGSRPVGAKYFIYNVIEFGVVGVVAHHHIYIFYLYFFFY